MRQLSVCQKFGILENENDLKNEDDVKNKDEPKIMLLGIDAVASQRFDYWPLEAIF